MSIASDKLVKECEEKMLKTIESVKERFTSIRAGRANVAMLDGVKVENYGSDVPLNQIGSVSAPEARLLVIDPWDKTLIPKIEKALLAARNIRKDINNHLKKLEKDKENPISEDELKKEEANVQTLTDKYIKEIDELLAKKEKEITTV